MATLPKSKVGAQRASTEAVDFSGLGQGVQALGEGVARGMYAVQRQNADSADRWAEQTVTAWKTNQESAVADATARYDGSKPGLTQGVLDQADRSFQPLLDAEADPVRRQALQKQFDGYRAQLGQRVSAFEADKRAEPIRREQATSEDLALSTLLIDRNKQLAAAQQARANQGAAGMVGYSDGIAADFDTATAEIEKGISNPALLARFREKSVADRFAAISKAQSTEEAARLGVVAQTVKGNLEALQNGLLVNPAGYDDAVKMAPTILAAINDPEMRAKADAEFKPLLARSYLDGLINTGQVDLSLIHI